MVVGRGNDLVERGGAGAVAVHFNHRREVVRGACVIGGVIGNLARHGRVVSSKKPQIGPANRAARSNSSMSVHPRREAGWTRQGASGLAALTPLLLTKR